MERARGGILAAAADLVAERGVRGVSMAGVARRGRVAKATVYNHFRDREELLGALLLDQWQQLGERCSELARADRLPAAAAWVAASPVLAGLREHDPAVLVRLVGAAVADQRVLADVASWTPLGDDPMTSLRWLVSFAVAPV